MEKNEVLKNYNDIKNDYKENILIGNGFSIHFDKKFSYPSLYDLCVKEKYLSEQDIKLFERFNKTKDFELILRMLYFSSEVGSAIIDNPNENVNKEEVIKYNTFISTKYETIRDALIKAIKDGHISYDEISENYHLDIIRKSIHRFNKVFTLNYDLLPYWATMSGNNKFVDFFFSNYFDSNNTEIYGNKKSIYYIHGSLYLFKESIFEQEKVGKISSGGEGLLNKLKDLFNKGRMPLFVSEGTSQKKKDKIYSNSYLSFCSNSLKKIKGTLTVFGWAFADQDQHIVDLLNINQANITKIAISIFTDNGSIEMDKTQELIRTIKAKLYKFDESKLTFFKTETFWENV